MLAAALTFLLSGAVAAPPLPLDALAGVYKHRFPNALVDGTNYTSEDVLEIVKVTPTTAYVRADLNFFNGHVCGVAAIFDSEAGGLIFRDPEAPTPGSAPCVLKLRVVEDRLEFGDGEGSCKSYCGARGSWGGEDFKLAARRPIRYLPRLLASSEYKAAVAAHATPPPRAR